MQCDDVARALAALVDAEVADPAVDAHLETCLRCQAELARYRRMLRGLHDLRTHYLEPSPGLLAQTLAAVEAASEPSTMRSLVTRKRLALAGAGAGAALAAGAVSALVISRMRRRGLAAA